MVSRRASKTGRRPPTPISSTRVDRRSRRSTQVLIPGPRPVLAVLARAIESHFQAESGEFSVSYYGTFSVARRVSPPLEPDDRAAYAIRPQVAPTYGRSPGGRPSPRLPATPTRSPSAPRQDVHKRQLARLVHEHPSSAAPSSAVQAFNSEPSVELCRVPGSSLSPSSWRVAATRSNTASSIDRPRGVAAGEDRSDARTASCWSRQQAYRRTCIDHRRALIDQYFRRRRRRRHSAAHLGEEDGLRAPALRVSKDPRGARKLPESWASTHLGLPLRGARERRARRPYAADERTIYRDFAATAALAESVYECKPTYEAALSRRHDAAPNFCARARRPPHPRLHAQQPAQRARRVVSCFPVYRTLSSTTFGQDRATSNGP